jgi:hypothetical protein
MAIHTPEKTLCDLNAEIIKLGDEQRRILGLWDIAINKFDLVVSRTKPELIASHRSWLASFRQESERTFQVAIRQLQELKGLCEKIAGKPAAQQQEYLVELTKIADKVVKNIEEFARKNRADTQRLMLLLEKADAAASRRKTSKR